MEKKIILILLAVSLAVVFLPVVSSKLLMYKIPVYVFDDPCNGKTIASIDFSKINDLSKVPNEDWIIGKNSNGGIADIEDGALRLSNAVLWLNTSTHPIPINVTVYAVVKVNRTDEEGYSNYAGYSQAYLWFQQNLYGEERKYKYPGMFIFSGVKGSGVGIRDEETSYGTKKINTFRVRTISSHYQTKWKSVNRNKFNDYIISRRFNGSNFVKKFLINGTLAAELNLTKPNPSGTKNEINYKDTFLFASYRYQAIYVKKVEVCGA